MHEAEDGGRDFVTMTVQVDPNCEIETYADNTDRIRFVLLGYWNGGKYIEKMETFTVPSYNWNEKELVSYGIADGDIVEILIANMSDYIERQAGVRKLGSSLDREVYLHECEGPGSGADYMTMLVEASDSNAVIEVFAGVAVDMSYTLLGYWQVAPGKYVELMTDIGIPSSTSTWEEKDLSSYGVPSNAYCEVLLCNDVDGQETYLGVRENGSTVDRKLEFHEAEDGHYDIAMMPVKIDSDKKIEWYSGSGDVKFYLTGYWE
jgi:hypothetical protein